MSRVIRLRRPPHVELIGGIVTNSDEPAEIGRARFFIELHDPDDGVLGVWDGESYSEALEVLALYRQDGMRAINTMEAP